MLIQYNLLDRHAEEAIAHAHEKGIGISIMGPIGGGRLVAPSEKLQSMVKGKAKSTPEIALRFVISNPNVSIALSGMNSMAMVEENCAVADNEEPLTPDERQQVIEILAQSAELAKLYCTGCNYCMPCPNDVNIPECFKYMNYHRVYGLTDYARQYYRALGREGWWVKGQQASACIECGQCEEKCPQKIPIIKQLKETHETLREKD
jgi:predicted aldo/keto reductase-like oxidoreductase